MEIDKLSVEELKRGYRFNANTNAYICNTCGKAFEIGEIYSFDNRFFEAARAIKIHVDTEHGDNLKQLLYGESKYNAFTDNQKELLSLIYSGLTDKEIAKRLGVSPSTVRHQRFMFREKAKQAKMYLAVYEQVIEKKSSDEDAIVPVHSNATMVDDRYLTTEKEKSQILKTAFASLSPLRLKDFSPKEKKKIVILTKIAEQFEYGKRYPEKELNQILKAIYDDYPVIRRYLIDYGFMERTDDCKEYWLKQ
ncbi:DUF2087 domain-containing protein [Geosporobacter ferrireducens]|uniref:Transcriptional regulator n=1 Tax=Geosporobacter ferrireducens TaxID=1424294 RepID=A0A1D8GEG8_9FIRM|nr:DUF2087 domain-containing protein [Geosporobacter ferrireducens]AOT69293.1 transcriptional regulator [Geosporobacter ferrireducens]MTI56976.1 DUF2087 domain-containing protein [Geosporobacter ferrireducens]